MRTQKKIIKLFNNKIMNIKFKFKIIKQINPLPKIIKLLKKIIKIKIIQFMIFK